MAFSCGSFPPKETDESVKPEGGVVSLSQLSLGRVFSLSRTINIHVSSRVILVHNLLPRDCAITKLLLTSFTFALYL